MSTTDNVLALLDKLPLWRQIKECPDRTDALEKRVAALEQKIGPDWPPDICKFCGKRAARMEHGTRPNEKGIYIEEWRCAECDLIERRSFKVR